MLRVGESVILRGLGDCRFERANEALGLDGGNAWTAAFSATWEGANTLPTLAFGRYVTVDASGDATYTCPRQPARPARRERHALRSADGPRARAGARSRCCSATGTTPADADLRV